MFDIYKGIRVFVTGHTGFKGSWLSLWLMMLDANVAGYSLPPDDMPSLFSTLDLEQYCANTYGDIADYTRLHAAMRAHQPAIIFHLAAQPFVRRSYAAPVETYRTNVMGTLNMLEAARACGSVRACVNITTDKCYENRETRHGYAEDDPLGGHDLYSSSKACAELLSASYRRSFLQETGFALATARAGNVIGGGDWGEDRLVPDCMRAWASGKPVQIRNPKAIRPWQHVLDSLLGYLLLGEKLLKDGRIYAEAFNFGPHECNYSVESVIQCIALACPGLSVIYEQTQEHHEAQTLMLNSEKAQRLLGWKTHYDAKKSTTHTLEWYKSNYEGKPMKEYTMQQIKNFMSQITSTQK